MRIFLAFRSAIWRIKFTISQCEFQTKKMYLKSFKNAIGRFIRSSPFDCQKQVVNQENQANSFHGKLEQ